MIFFNGLIRLLKSTKEIFSNSADDEERDVKEMTDIELKEIEGKKVYIFESHHYALLPWAELKRQHTDEEILLFSFDHHTDTIDPFLRYAFDEESQKPDEELAKKLINGIDYHSEDSITDAIKKLRNDEHIKTAIQSGILSKALIIAYKNAFEKPESNEEKKRISEWHSPEAILQQIGGTYQMTSEQDRTYPESDIYMPGFDYDSDEADFWNDDFLKESLATLSRMSGLVDSEGDVKKKYILDIDLDYFHVSEAAEPKEASIIGRLIRNAEIVTIAKETACVEMCSEGRCTSEDLLCKVVSLIEKALR